MAKTNNIVHLPEHNTDKKLFSVSQSTIDSIDSICKNKGITQADVISYAVEFFANNINSIVIKVD